jgi:hypothetical protein
MAHAVTPEKPRLRDTASVDEGLLVTMAQQQATTAVKRWVCSEETTYLLKHYRKREA